MDDSTPVNALSGAADVPDRLFGLRDVIFNRWQDCVRHTIPEASSLDDKILTNALKRFFDELVFAIRKGAPYSVGTSGVGPSASHGRERANSTAYGPEEVLLELQLFRQTLLEVADANHVILNRTHRSVIGRSIDTAMRDAINAFAIVQKEAGETFITSLSHDLRNPLHVANASAQLIQLKTHDDSVLTLARRIRKKLADVDEMIETLLDAAFIKGRKKLRLVIHQFNMAALAKEVCSDMSSDERPIQCTGEDVEGYWCSSSMRRVFENLLSNAIKYGYANTSIAINIKQLDGIVCISVHNEGHPIPEHERHLLFSTFHRFEDITVTGWGLGLPFVRLVTESHGGVITAKSTAADGTTFCINMPIDCRSYNASS